MPLSSIRNFGYYPQVTSFTQNPNQNLKPAFYGETTAQEKTKKTKKTVLTVLGLKAALAVLFLTKGKGKVRKPDGRHISFKKAKTIEEARDYARNVLGIKKFDIPDLEMANQFNLSTTRAYNKIGCSDLIPDEVLIGKVNHPYSNAETQPLWNSKTRIVFSSDYLNKLNSKIKISIAEFRQAGQIVKTGKGGEKIDLFCDYLYGKH